jgi:hypothetical protein
VSAAVDPVPPATGSIWCSARHPIADLVICKKLRHSPTVLHNSRNVPDWAETVRVSPPTTSNEETNR